MKAFRKAVLREFRKSKLRDRDASYPNGARTLACWDRYAQMNWSYDTVVEAFGMAIDDDENVYVCTGSDSTKLGEYVNLWKFDRTGKPLWAVLVPVVDETLGDAVVDIAYHSGYVYAVTLTMADDANVYKIDASDGSVVASWDCGFAPESIAYGGGRLCIVGSYDRDPQKNIAWFDTDGYSYVSGLMMADRNNVIPIEPMGFTQVEYVHDPINDEDRWVCVGAWVSNGPGYYSYSHLWTRPEMVGEVVDRYPSPAGSYETWYYGEHLLVPWTPAAPWNKSSSGGYTVWISPEGGDIFSANDYFPTLPHVLAYDPGIGWSWDYQIWLTTQNGVGENEIGSSYGVGYEGPNIYRPSYPNQPNDMKMSGNGRLHVCGTRNTTAIPEDD